MSYTKLRKQINSSFSSARKTVLFLSVPLNFFQSQLSSFHGFLHRAKRWRTESDIEQVVAQLGESLEGVVALSSQRWVRQVNSLLQGENFPAASYSTTTFLKAVSPSTLSLRSMLLLLQQ